MFEGRRRPLRSLGAAAAQVRKIGTNLHKRINTQEDLMQVHFPWKSHKKPYFAYEEIPVKMAYGETRLFFIGDEEDVKSVAHRCVRRQ